MDKSKSFDKNTKINKCQICDEEFGKMSMKAHIANVHKNAKKQLLCKICEKVFKTQYMLKKHLSRIHDNTVTAGSITCNICTKTFHAQQILNNHIKTVHGGQKNNRCESCSKSFSRAGHLKNHIYTVHKGHKGHKCESF